MLKVYFLLILHILLGTDGTFILPVENQQWTVTNGNGSIAVPATVPGGIYTDLMNSGILGGGNFYYRYNDVNYRWVSYENWTYQTTFTATKRLLAEENVALIFEGLDTFASVFLDDNLVLEADNMFVSYKVDVKNLLKVGESHNLTISFTSPINEAAARNVDYYADNNYYVVPDCFPDVQNGECHVNYARKMQASFSWDWGPAFPGCGIWKPWSLIGWSSLQIDDIIFTTSPRAVLPNVPTKGFMPGWTISTKIWLNTGSLKGDINGTLDIRLSNTSVCSKSISAKDKSFLNVTFDIEKNFVSIWWPSGLGEQTLYDLEVTWSSGLGEVSTKTIRVGFRTVELDQSFVNEHNETMGRNYIFKINNVTIFMKGSNWIPAHVLPEQVTENYVSKLLEAAKMANQNCLRVWGGGIYESDYFYQKADELGLLIWEDLMYACAMYPTDSHFLVSATQEMITQVRRLQYHPSVIVWASNNENEAALRQNWYGTAKNYSVYYEDYVELYINTLRKVVVEEDPSREFVVSSPSNGIESEEEGFVAQHPYDNRYGDVHYYNYVLNGWHWHNYPPTRFASEYGFQSWPSLRTFSQATNSCDWTINSDMMEHRQHHLGGNSELDMQLGTHMRYDAKSTSFEHYLYMTQIHQAMAIKTETEFYRRMRSILNADGSGLTHGALYWQLNDIWQGASWSSIEYGGRWKMLHYYSKNFFEPILVIPFIDLDESLKVYIVNDEFEDLRNVEIIIRIHSYRRLGSHVVFDTVTDAPSEASSLVTSLDVKTIVQNVVECQVASFNPEEVCFVMVEVEDKDEQRIVTRNFALLSEPKNSALLKANIVASNISRSGETLAFDLTTDAVALFVWLETDYAGHFSDNGFMMVNSLVTLQFYPDEPIRNWKTFIDTLQITSLSDTY